MSGKKWVRRTELSQRGKVWTETVTIHIDTSGFTAAIGRGKEKIQSIWGVWGAASSGISAGLRAAAEHEHRANVLLRGSISEDSRESVQAEARRRSQETALAYYDAMREVITERFQEITDQYTFRSTGDLGVCQFNTSHNPFERIQLEGSSLRGWMPRYGGGIQAPSEDHPSGDAMTMRFDLEATETCWKKVGTIEVCGEPADPRSETGVCAMHLEGYKR